jgi:hypothetical protein
LTDAGCASRANFAGSAAPFCAKIHQPISSAKTNQMLKPFISFDFSTFCSAGIAPALKGLSEININQKNNKL